MITKADEDVSPVQKRAFAERLRRCEVELVLDQSCSMISRLVQSWEKWSSNRAKTQPEETGSGTVSGPVIAECERHPTLLIELCPLAFNRGWALSSRWDGRRPGDRVRW